MFFPTYLLCGVYRVSENAACKMPVDNLATVFGPTVVGYSTAEPTMQHIMTQTNLQQQVLCLSLSVCLSVTLWGCFMTTFTHTCIKYTDSQVWVADMTYNVFCRTSNPVLVYKTKLQVHIISEFWLCVCVC